MLIKRFIRVKKIDSLKNGIASSSNNKVNEFIDFDIDTEFEDEDDGLLNGYK